MVPYIPRMLCAGLGAVALLMGCEVRGIIGDNRGMDGDGAAADDAGDGTATVTDGGGASDSVGTTGGGADGSNTTSGVVDGSDDDTIFDLGQPDAPAVCSTPLPVVCDEIDDDPWHAMGLDCEGGFSGFVSYSGDPRSLYVQDGQLGTSGVYAPRQGTKMVILSTGDAQQIPMTPAELEATGCVPEACPSQEFNPIGMLKLPDPIDVHKVSDDGRDCNDDPTLIGKGDCSNTLHDQWVAGQSAHDYAEVRLQAVVPDDANAFTYQFAFFTIEYPLFAGQDSMFNDMYLAWLQSERWTGNVSFDDEGHPISIQGVFLQYQDDPPNSPQCPTCGAPELAGFAAQGHGGTDWLSTVAPVSPGEQIEIVLAIMDLSDGLFDSAVVLDGFQWTCTDQAPITTPVG